MNNNRCICNFIILLSDRGEKLQGDVIVFNTKATSTGCPVDCMGGDYDGDLYFICGDENIVPWIGSDFQNVNDSINDGESHWSEIDCMCDYKNNTQIYELMPDEDVPLMIPDIVNKRRHSLPGMFTEYTSDLQPRIWAGADEEMTDVREHKESRIFTNEVENNANYSVLGRSESFISDNKRWDQGVDDIIFNFSNVCVSPRKDFEKNKSIISDIAISNGTDITRYPNPNSAIDNYIRYAYDWEKIFDFNSFLSSTNHLSQDIPSADLTTYLFIEFIAFSSLSRNPRYNIGTLSSSWLIAADKYGSDSEQATSLHTAHDLMMSCRKKSLDLHRLVK